MGKIQATGTSNGTIDCDGADGLSRRSFFKTGMFGFMGLGLLDLMKASVLAEGAEVSKCDSVILVWLAGGPSHIDTFDPKPGQATGGPVKAINTSADGIQISEYMPVIARNMKHAALIRSLTSKEGSHERATYEMHTGYKPLGSIKHPSVGSLVVQQKDKKNPEIPAYISIGGTSFGAGFLGTQVAPFYIGDPNNPTRNLDFPANVDHDRFKRRVDLLTAVDKEFSGQKRSESINEYGQYYKDAVRMMYSKSVEAFDLNKEPEIYRKGYGDNNFGKSCLMARRLIEKGVRFVEVSLGGWDNHQNVFEAVERNCNTLDPALGTLIEDLNARGLLKRTMVVCTGEFGRTPKINANNGRDHYPRVWSGLVAGGGIKSGYVHGASDATGSEVKDGAVGPGELHATMFDALGVDFTKENQTDQGRPIRIVDKGKPVKDLLS
ncbi:MAG: DUF1501 domain-containing protein [Planctomycetota bacterium]|nr:DUF1501 domain-containing protein [Planctomycetota bacterium]